MSEVVREGEKIVGIDMREVHGIETEEDTKKGESLYESSVFVQKKKGKEKQMSEGKK